MKPLRWIVRQASWRLMLLCLSLTLMVMAAKEVSIDRSQQVLKAMVVFDITQSMNVQDVRVGRRVDTRLAASKALLQRLLQQLPCGSEMGVGLFTGHRSFVLFTPVEVCGHFNEISQVVASIDWRMAWAARSEVAKGIHSGLLVSAEISDDTRLIFLTDGHEAPPVSDQFPPKYKGRVGDVKGVLIGVGGDLPQRIPKYDPNGRFIGYWRASEVQQIDSYRAGRPVGATESMSGVDNVDTQQLIAAGREHLSSLKGDYLRTLALKLGLQYHRAAANADINHIVLSDELSVAQAGQRDISRQLAALSLLLLVGHLLWPAVPAGD